MAIQIDLTGKRFGRLVVISKSGHHITSTGNQVQKWKCYCDCGTELDVPGVNLRTGDTKSCGCWFRDQLGSSRTVHGYSGTPTYRSWKSMNTRCNNPNVPNYKNYGGRGIKITERWSEFANFLADMGSRPFGTTLDRIDVNGDYEPGNCRWATLDVQARNRRDNRFITYAGLILCMNDWSSLLKVSSSCIRKRILKEGMENALDRLIKERL